jgi:plastocyanin
VSLRVLQLRLVRLGFLTASMTVVLVILAACSGGTAPSPTATPAPPVAPAALATIATTATPVAVQAAASGLQVSIDNFSFTPATITIPAGTTVTWVNHDDTPHTVTASDKSFGSAAINTDNQFSHTFTTPGAYNYFCSIHLFMTAKVIVQ